MPHNRGNSEEKEKVTVVERASITGALSFYIFCQAKFATPIVTCCFSKERGEKMFNKLFMTMSYTTFCKWQLLAMASGALTVGSWWAMHELAKKYASEDEEARH